MKKSAPLIFSIILISACSSAPTINHLNIDYQAGSQARLRLYGQNGNPTVISYKHENKNTKINVGGSLGDAFGSFLGAKKSESIGMPATEISEKLASKNAWLSRAFFREITVPANVEIIVDAAVIPLANIEKNPYTGKATITQASGCSSKFKFITQASTDYEVASNGCTVMVYEIRRSLAGIELIPIN